MSTRERGGEPPSGGPFEAEAEGASEGLPLLQTRRGVVPFRRGYEPHAETGRLQPPAEEPLPARYEVRETEDGQTLRCKEAPGLAVRLDRAFAFTEADARKLGERVVLLDGAGQFPPLLDDSAHVYNLDHHQGCLRAFTLATCEQALILVLKGLDLEKGDWAIYANEPDLDTVFALWVLLNHRRVRNLSTRAKEVLLPMLRLEGAIDANGYELAEYSGLPQHTREVAKQRLDGLFERELEAKREGLWADMDLCRFTQEQLAAIDELVYIRSDFSDFDTVEHEYGHVEIGQDRVAVVCRDSTGIYEVEKRLRKVWGDRLGIVALAKDGNHFTLRRTASLAGIDLHEAYDRLNLLDRVVDGRPPEKRWGGSDEIGGSPRPDGTSLSPNEIGKILRLTYRRRRPLALLKNVAYSFAWSAGLALAGILCILLLRAWTGEPSAGQGRALELALFAGVAGLGAWLLTLDLARRRTYIFGWRWPAGRDWLVLVPLVLVGAAAGGAWIPRGGLPSGALLSWLGASALAAVCAEMWFRGLAHGRLILDAPIQSLRGRWFVSRATLASAAVYATVTTSISEFLLAPSPLGLQSPWHLAACAAGSLLAGLALGMIRERSLSLVPCIFSQILAALVAILLGLWLAA